MQVSAGFVSIVSTKAAIEEDEVASIVSKVMLGSSSRVDILDDVRAEANTRKPRFKTLHQSEPDSTLASTGDQNYLTANGHHLSKRFKQFQGDGE